MAIMSSFGSNERDKYIGIVEAANGLGLLVGPLAGATLYTIGGFALPFLFFASLLVLCAPFILCILYSAG